MSVKVVNNLPQYKKILDGVLNDVMRSTAHDILMDAQNTAPIKTGALRRESDHRQLKMLHWRITFWQEYASYQERGSRHDGSRRVRNYSQAGTGKKFLQNAADKSFDKMPAIFKRHIQGRMHGLG